MRLKGSPEAPRVGPRISKFDSLRCGWDFIMTHIQIDSKSFEDDVIQFSSRAMSDPPLSEIDFKSEMDSPLNYP